MNHTCPNHNGPCPHSSCLIAAIRGARQGLYYGGKVRMTHSIVMQYLFGRGTTLEKLKTSIKLSWIHGRNLGSFVFIYKIVQCLLTQAYGKRHPAFSFIAGIIGAFFIWSERNTVNQQLAFYLFSRICEGIAVSLQKSNIIPETNAFSYVSIITWGIVMFLFERDKSTLQKSLSNSMTFLYHDSDHTSGWRDFVPFHVPEFN